MEYHLQVSRMAFKDISLHLRKKAGLLYVVTPFYLDTKQSRILNKELGLNKLNYMGNKNQYKIRVCA